MKYLKTKKSFRKEFRRQLRLAVVAAMGFIVAYAWRNAIYRAAENLIGHLIGNQQFVLTELLTALLITFCAVIVILITTKLLKEK